MREAKAMDTPKNRKEALKNDFNNTWKAIFGGNVDYYSQIKDEQFPLLKNALSCINNIITLQVTEDFVRAYAPKVFSDDEVQSLMNEVMTTDANANGFDVQYPHEHPTFIAEVKCNIPVNGNRFGAQQVSGIIKDLDYLTGNKEKTKSGCSTEDVKNAYCFMVVMEYSGSKEAMHQIVDKYNEGNEGMKVVEYHDGEQLSTDAVYVVYVKPRKV